jgi:hypothetical protein
MKITRKQIRRLLREEREVTSPSLSSTDIDTLLTGLTDMMDDLLRRNEPDELQEVLSLLKDAISYHRRAADELQGLVDMYSSAEILPRNWASPDTK